MDALAVVEVMVSIAVVIGVGLFLVSLLVALAREFFS